MDVAAINTSKGAKDKREPNSRLFLQRVTAPAGGRIILIFTGGVQHVTCGVWRVACGVLRVACGV